MKRLLMIMAVTVLAFGLSACSNGDSLDNGNNKDVVDEENNDDLLELTLEELAMYDGKNGNDAYVAVNGVIYDVTGVAAWTNGTHNGNMAGTDVSSAINNAPHGTSVLDGLDVVGTLID